ncbi:glycosyltransferase family 2 protein [Pseudodesulfovibrio hydrargyri]|uniref:glycosyltransferase family 2 protein n=1 Tax=Pseudodesulfovibrio hydrargyri TaxID=2125990 RepID=UPI0008FB1908|nr:glycosyltransferase family A protein [Pseudodesulfovibrio hydrargyri]
MIASYNYGRYLSQTLDSVLAQTRQPDEIVVVDDGSTDNTREVAAPYVERGQIKYIHQENAGVSAAKQRAVEESSGELLAFLDADDMWEPTKLEKQLPLFENGRIGAVYSKRFIIDEHGERSSFQHPPFYRGDIINQIFAYNFIAFSSTVVRRSVFERAGGYDFALSTGEDYDLWIRMAALCEFDYIDEPLICYRRGHSNLTSNTPRLLANTVNIMRKELGDSNIASRLSRHAVRTAWASVFSAYGRLRAAEGKPGQAFSMFCKSLFYQPFMAKTWNGLASLLLPRPCRNLAKRFIRQR